MTSAAPGRRPELVQFGDLGPAHFERHSVWASCSSFDSDEAWFAETDEETFRPWTGGLPVDPAPGMFLVKADFRLADGSELSGFVTPATGPADEELLGLIQPQIFLPSGKPFGFWLGMFGKPGPAAAALYAALGREARAVFPLRFSVRPGVILGLASGEVRGFYTVAKGKGVQVTV